MPWEKEEWIDDDGSLTVGTPFDAAHMNNIELGIFTGLNAILNLEGEIDAIEGDIEDLEVLAGSGLATAQAAYALAGSGLITAQAAGVIAASGVAVAGSALVTAQGANLLAGSALATGQAANVRAGSALATGQGAGVLAGSALITGQAANVLAGSALTTGQAAGAVAGSALITGQQAQVMAASGITAAGSALVTGQKANALAASGVVAAGSAVTGVTSLLNRLALSGMGVVLHGSDANAARPAGYDSVFWIGTVEPKNGAATDPWLNPEDFGEGESRDFGIVTALPSQALALKAGDRCLFKAATGVYWDLIYTGEETYPWAKIGGPPLRKMMTEESKETASTSYQFGGAPSLSVPLNMEADIAGGASLVANRVNELNEVRIALHKGSTELNWGGVCGSNTFDGAPAAVKYRTTLTNAESVSLAYKSISGKNGSFWRMWVEIDPLRVGY